MHFFLQILLLGGPSPPSQLVPNPFNWSPDMFFVELENRSVWRQWQPVTGVWREALRSTLSRLLKSSTLSHPRYSKVVFQQHSLKTSPLKTHPIPNIKDIQVPTLFHSLSSKVALQQSLVPPSRVAKCHGFDGYIRVKKLASWGKKFGRPK